MLNDSNAIASEVTSLERELNDLKAKQKADAAKESVAATYGEIFKGRELYYVQSHDKIYEYRRTGTSQPWIFFSTKAFVNEDPVLRQKDGIMLFMLWLKQTGHYFLDATYSFRPQHATVLNFMRTEHWLKPVEGDVHEMYDVLMLTLGGGKQEGKDHLEQLIVCKYKNPSDFLLSCVTWSGEGSGGKNLLVDGILGAIFGQEQVRSPGLENITGAFNSIIRGRTVVLMNEAATKKVDMEKLKNLVGQPTIQINEKYLPVMQVDNTPMYFIATNDPMSIPLADNKSDRRWSIIQLTESLDTVLARHLNCGESQARDLWVNKFADELKDPENLQAWLHHLLQKWAHVTRPDPLHGEDYAQSIAIKREASFSAAALSRLTDLETWVPMAELYLHVTGEEQLVRDYRYHRFCAEVQNEIKKRKLPLSVEANKKHTPKFGRVSSGIIIRHHDYAGTLTANHFLG